MSSDPHLVVLSEAPKRNFFHRLPAPVMRARTVVNDSTATDVDAVMGKGKTRCNEVCAHRWFFVSCQKAIASTESDRNITLSSTNTERHEENCETFKQDDHVSRCSACSCRRATSRSTVFAPHYGVVRSRDRGIATSVPRSRPDAVTLRFAPRAFRCQNRCD